MPLLKAVPNRKVRVVATLEERMAIVDVLRNLAIKFSNGRAVAYNPGWVDAKVAAEVGPHISAAAVKNIRSNMFELNLRTTGNGIKARVRMLETKVAYLENELSTRVENSGDDWLNAQKVT